MRHITSDRFKYMKTRTKYFATVVFALLAITAMGQTVKDYARINQLSAENAKAMKEIKKAHQLKNVSIELKDETGWYYLLQAKGKGNNMGVADSLGNVIIEPAYNEVKYVPALPEGNGALGVVNGNQQYIYHEARPAHFLAKRYGGGSWANDSVSKTAEQTAILDIQGNIIHKGFNYRYVEMPGYLAIGANYLLQRGVTGSNRFRVGLMTSLGEVILEPKYTEIMVEIDNPDYLFLEKEIDGVKRKGVYGLKEKKMIIPCVYTEVWHSKGKWEVKKNETDMSEEFDPNTAVQDISYRDDGERFFDRKEYDKTIEFYAKEGVDAPWAKFFTGKAILQKAYYASYELLTFKTSLELSKGAAQFQYIDFEAAKNYCKEAERLFEAYMQQGDEQYRKQAESELDICRYLPQSLDKENQEYQALVAQWRQYKAAAEAQAAAEEQRARENAAAFAAMFGTMMNSISNSLNNPSQPSRRTSVPTSAGVSTSSSSDSSSSSSAPANTAERKTCPRCHGDKTIVVEHSISAGYGLEVKKTTCSTCGKSYDKNGLTHIHERCPSCRGLGYYEVK